MPKNSATAGAPPTEREPTARETARAAGTPSDGAQQRAPAPSRTDSTPDRHTPPRESDYDRLRRLDSKALMGDDTPEEVEDVADETIEKPAEEAAPETPADPGDTTEETPAEPQGETPESTEEKPADKPEETAEEPGEADPDDLNEEERRRLPKKIAKQFDRVLKSRAEARKQLETVKPKVQVFEAIEADLKEAGINLGVLKQRMEFEKELSRMNPQQRAQRFREIADHLDPAGSRPAQPLALPDDIQNLVDAGVLKREDAETVARSRQPAQPPAQQQRQQPPAQQQPFNQPQQSQFIAADAPWTTADESKGADEMNRVDTEYRTRFPADWPKLAVEVNKEIRKEAARIRELTGFRPKPDQWGKLSREVAERVIKRHAKPLKTPPRNIGTSRPATQTNRAYETKEELSARLQRGEL